MVPQLSSLLTAVDAAYEKNARGLDAVKRIADDIRSQLREDLASPPPRKRNEKP